jgi:hypothetical protein
MPGHLLPALDLFWIQILTKKPNKWVTRLSGIMFGWLVFLISIYVLGLSSSFLIYNLGFSTHINTPHGIIATAICLSASILLAYYFGKKVALFLKSKSYLYNIILVLILSLLTIFTLISVFRPPHDYG